MKKSILLKTLYALTGTLLVSCATTKSVSQKGTVHGMVTDMRGEPVANYAILDAHKKTVATTDDRGFFYIEHIPSDKKEFTGFKQNWESAKFDFSKVPLNRLYITQVKNAKDLKNEFEAALEQENYYQAEKTASQCEGGAITEAELALYRSVLAYKRGDFMEAKKLLAAIDKNNKTPSGAEQGADIGSYEALLDSKIQNTAQEKEGEEK